MAALSITAASVLKGANSQTLVGTCAETITAGKPIYRTTAGTFGLFDPSSATKNELVGVAIQGGSTGQPFVYLRADAALTLGSFSAHSGLPCFAISGGLSVTPSDVATGHKTNVAGVFNDDGTLNLSIVTGGSKL